MLEASAAEMPNVTLAPVSLPSPRAPSMRSIVAVVAALCGITPHDILASPSRTVRIAHPRQLAMHLCWRAQDRRASQTIVGNFFDKDHTTVLHASQQVRQRLGTSEAWSLIHDRALLCLADPSLPRTALPVPGAKPPDETARPSRARIVVLSRQSSAHSDPWLARQRAKWRDKVGRQTKSCEQIGKFCASFGAL